MRQLRKETCYSCERKPAHWTVDKFCEASLDEQVKTQASPKGRTFLRTDRSLKIQMKVPGWVIHGKFTVHQREPSQTIARNLAGTRLLGWMASGHTPPELPGRGSLGAQCPEVWQESGGSGGVG